MKYLNYTVTGRARTPLQRQQRTASLLGFALVAALVVAFTLWAVEIQVESMVPAPAKALTVFDCTAPLAGPVHCAPRRGK